jgi:ABC-type bacteriocin/lantibiotic exporter with double-glycine peptidase domain
VRELSGRTRVLVTHAFDCLPKVDRIVVMGKGKVEFDGTYEELLETKYYLNIKESLDSTQIKSSP